MRFFLHLNMWPSMFTPLKTNMSPETKMLIGNYIFQPSIFRGIAVSSQGDNRADLGSNTDS